MILACLLRAPQQSPQGVDAQHHLTVAREVIDTGSDRNQLATMAAQARKPIGTFNQECEGVAIYDALDATSRPGAGGEDREEKQGQQANECP